MEVGLIPNITNTLPIGHLVIANGNSKVMSDAGSDIEHIILKAVGFHTVHVTIGLHKVSFSM